MDSLWTVCKTIGITMTFGAYHLYRMNTQWNLRQKTYTLQNQRMTDILHTMKN